MELNLSQVVAQELRLDGESAGFLTAETAAIDVLAFYSIVENIPNDPQERWSKRELRVLTASALLHFEAGYTWLKMDYKFQSANVDVREYPLRYLVRVDRAFELRLDWEGRLVKQDVTVTLHFTADSQIGAITPPPPNSRDHRNMYESFKTALANLKSS